MKKLDLKNWNRREIYELFGGMQFPHFSVSSEVDVTELLSFADTAKLPSYRLFLYIVCRAANEVRAFRLRLAEDGVSEHQSVGIAPTVPWKEGLFSFLCLPYIGDPAVFLKAYADGEARVKKMDKLNLEDDAAIGDACIYTSCVPWFHMVAATNPLASARDSIPRVMWGKYIKREGRMITGVAIQCHHALVDGADIAAFLGAVQRMCNSPRDVFGAVSV